MSNKVLVTGAAGFIGAFLVKKLLEETDDVIVGLDNLNNYYDPGIKDARLRMLAEADTDGRFTFVRGDLCDAALVERLFAENGFDVVVNLRPRPVSATPSRTRAPTSRATSSASSTSLRHAATTRLGTSSTPAPARFTAATRRCRSPRRTAWTRQCRSTPPPRSPTSSWPPPTQSSTPSRRPACASLPCTAPWAGRHGLLRLH